ncbi:MAG: long-chain fatty acid--CoA ligase [Actinomycetota bacterium]|jgi:long-chain acyl-CoA synthetase
MIRTLLDRMADYGPAPALAWEGAEVSYTGLLERIAGWRQVFEAKIPKSSVVALVGDFSPDSVAALLALIEHRCIVVPITTAVGSQRAAFLDQAECEWVLDALEGKSSLEGIDRTAGHSLLLKLKAIRHPGLVLFSSGSTGKSKAALHDFVPLLMKFEQPRAATRTLSFLLFDHIGGVNTMFHTLSSGGCLVTVSDRSPEGVCQAIERHRVEVLPTSPSFLNLLLLSAADRRHDLSSLKLITYGTEVMPERTLQRLHEAFPWVALKQTYGLSELGIMRSKSREDGSLWVKVGGEGFETRVVDGKLEIKARSAMLGYLNAPSPFTADGWFQTDDAVEVDGDWIKILGRASEIINVGGQKVYPAEVESALLAVDGVVDVVVTGQRNDLLGQIVVARVLLSTDETLAEFRVRARRLLKERLEPFKIPQKIELVAHDLHGARFKKVRASSAAES